VTQGFGWSFYGFLLYAVVWVTGYLCWAHFKNRRERGDP
jgi:hypothetical protein